MRKILVATTALNKQVKGPDERLDILKDINLEVHEGEAIAILGASGSGKSTLLGLLAGLDQISSGEITLFDQPLSSLSEDQRALLRAGRIGFVFQSFQLLTGMTALENVMLPLELAGHPQARSRSLTTLEQVGLAKRVQHYPNQLSGGEQQRVAIARAFALEPELLFADEPTGNLDQATGRQITDLLFNIREETDTTLILVTHDAELAERCNRQLHLDNGRMVTQ
ncbi:MAG: ATP-binding cassette domain-containing protein [Gammaproteobacteria bacterium]|nr:ATP-binding cassette domain-containing protein [Gammaproteobacteria bacterium]